MLIRAVGDIEISNAVDQADSRTDSNNMKRFSNFETGVGFAALLFFAGCATKPQVKPGFTFFPPPPDEPRIQYLATISSDADLGGGSKFGGL